MPPSKRPTRGLGLFATLPTGIDLNIFRHLSAVDKICFATTSTDAYGLLTSYFEHDGSLKAGHLPGVSPERFNVYEFFIQAGLQDPRRQAEVRNRNELLTRLDDGNICKRLCRRCVAWHSAEVGMERGCMRDDGDVWSGLEVGLMYLPRGLRGS